MRMHRERKKWEERDRETPRERLLYIRLTVRKVLRSLLPGKCSTLKVELIICLVHRHKAKYTMR